MGKNIILLLTLLTAIATTRAADRLTVNDVTITQGGQATMTVSFSFGVAGQYAGYQFAMKLPDGITPVTNSNGGLLITAGNSHDASAVPASNYYSQDGTWIVACYSTAGATLKGTQGQLLTITLKADAAITAGTVKSATISDIRLATADNRSVRPAAATINFNITVAQPADTRVVLDETSATAPTAAKGVSVRVLRSIKGGLWNTIVLPFAITSQQQKTVFGNDVKVADFSGYTAVYADGSVDNIDVHFRTFSGTMQANRPYLIMTRQDVTEFSLSGVDITPDDSPAIDLGTDKRWQRFIGTYKANTIVPREALFINDGKFWYSAGKTVMKGYRAFFDFYDVLPSAAASRIVMHFDDAEATGISSASSADAEGDDSYYNLHGQRVAQPAKGVFIRGSKKVVRE